MSGNNKVIRLVVFDWAGTTIDHGCLAPLQPFLDVFSARGIQITPEQARGPMGLHKKDHIMALAMLPDVKHQWRQLNHRDLTPDDIEDLYQQFIPLQLEVLDRHSQVIPGVLDCVKRLRQRNIRIGATTGFFLAAAQRVYQSAEKQGYIPDCCVCAEEVTQGRPAPWMIHRIMQFTRIDTPSAVVKVGDTIPDIEEGLAAGAWSVGVMQSSSLIGLTLSEWESLSLNDQKERLHHCRQKFLQAGCHAVIQTLAELPQLIDHFDTRLQLGETP